MKADGGKYAGTSCFFETFLRPVEYWGISGKYPLEPDEQCKLFYKAEQGAVLSIFWHDGAVLLKFSKGACGLSCALRAMKVNRTILFVEDDAVVLTTYRNLLQREGFRIESAQDGLEALKALSQATPIWSCST